MTELVRYEKDKHYADMVWWYVQWSMPAPAPEILPEMGLVAPGVAVCFLYKTDSSMAMIEGLVVNPNAGLKERSKAVNDIINGLCDIAKELGFTKVIGLTQDGGTFRRTLRLGFKDLGSYHLVAKGL